MIFNEELTKFVSLKETYVYVSEEYSGSTRVCYWRGQYIIQVSAWLYTASLTSRRWKRALNALLMHEKGHIVHGDCRRATGINGEVHSRKIPVLSEARADRYACQCGFGRDLIMAETMLVWKNWAWFRSGDIKARIMLMRRYIAKH